MCIRILTILMLVFLCACSSVSGGATVSSPANEPLQPTLTPIPLPTKTVTPLPTIDPATLPANCLDDAAAGKVVESWLNRKGYATLKEGWQAYLEEDGEENLVSSTTDYNNEFAHAVTWEKMLLVGEFPFRFEIDGNVGVGYCSILVYAGGMGPEIGLGITDVTLGDEWSGYASGLVDSKEATRKYLADRVGKAVTVRYMVAQNPQDEGFERAGFFSPLTRRLWDGSYYTKIPTDLNLLNDRVGQPRGPSIREIMGLASELKGIGVFLEYIVDAVQ
jgi:hypothetical protein